MSQRYSNRYRSRTSSRQHVRRPNKRSFPTWFVVVIGLVGLIALGLVTRTVFMAIFGGDDSVAEAQSNRLWLSEEWTLGSPSESDLTTLAQRLQDHKISVVYVETGAWRQDNQYRAWENAEGFRQQLREVAPNVKALIWLWYEPELHANDTSQSSAVNYVRQAVENWGYDGVHIQGYSIFSDSQSYLRLIRAMDQVIADRILSVSVPPDHNPTDVDVPSGLGNPQLSWRPAYKGDIAAVVDEMVIMAHASGLTDRTEYERWVAYQVETYARDIDRLDSNTDLIVALPAYPQELFHDPAIEDITTAANGARQGVGAAGSAGNVVRGAGIYIYQFTTDADWQAFEGFWLE